LPSSCPRRDNSFYADNPYLNHNYGEFISRELVDYTRKIFPLSPARDDAYIAGMSMGGFGAMYNALRHSDVFRPCHRPVRTHRRQLCAIPPTSPIFMGITRGYYDAVLGTNGDYENSDSNLFHLAERVHREGGDCADLYLACGYNDLLVRDSRKLHRFLTDKGIPHFYEEGPGTHEWSFWREYLRRGLERSIQPRPIGGKHHPFWIERDEKGVM
jgi:S-formylglutathione hydrolase FrmB